MKHFILIYDRRRDELREPPREYAQGGRALRAFEKLERELADDPTVTLALLGGESLDAIKITHANFFERDSLEKLERFFPPLLPA